MVTSSGGLLDAGEVGGAEGRGEGERAAGREHVGRSGRHLVRP